jgi:PEP-CTERM motif
MRHAPAASLCLVVLTMAAPALGTPVAFTGSADFDARFVRSSHLRVGSAIRDVSAFLDAGRPVTTNAGDIFEEAFRPSVFSIASTFVGLQSERPFTSLAFDAMRFVLAPDDSLPVNAPVGSTPTIAAPVVSADALPEPATLVLLGSGLVAVASAMRQSKNGSRIRRRVP